MWYDDYEGENGILLAVLKPKSFVDGSPQKSEYSDIRTCVDFPHK